MAIFSDYRRFFRMAWFFFLMVSDVSASFLKAERQLAEMLCAIDSTIFVLTSPDLMIKRDPTSHSVILA